MLVTGLFSFKGAWMQKHHGAREVFLTQQVDNNEMELLLRVARVCSPARIQDFDTENDVFVCEYEYDTAWQVRASDISYCPWIRGHAK